MGLGMAIFTAMAIGAGIGALAGFAVYGAKVLFSKKESWSWKSAAAHTVGGLVGGGLFAPVLAGLAAVGVPTAAAYVLAGGISWGGIWTAAQDATSWGLGQTKGMGSVGKYVTATAIGVVATALLLPIASRAIGPGMHLAKHPGTVNAFITPTRGAVTANVLKAEAEFLTYGALNETANVLIRGGTNAMTRAGTRALVRAPNAVRVGGTRTAVEGVDALRVSHETTVEEAPSSPFGTFAERLRVSHEEEALPPPPGGSGVIEAFSQIDSSGQTK